ncbi:MAG: MG2 domain-containing protein, partial [Bauldia litoralis]
MRILQAALIGLFSVVAIAGWQPAVRAEYKNLELAASAEAFRESLVKKYGNRPNASQAATNWAAARNLTRQRNWKGAIPLLERAAGYGQNDHRFWLQFSYALGAVTPSRARTALVTAYLAKETAKTRPQLAQALYYIGFWHERQRQTDEAISAYEDSVRIQRNTRVVSKLNALVARTRQQVMSTSTVHESDAPQLCVTFSRPLPSEDLGLYARYIAVEPKIKAAFSVSDKKLCIEGVEHDKTYRVTVRAGLPDKEDTFRTLKAETLTVSVPDRSPSVGFRGKSYVLAKSGPQTVPLTSVNVTKASLSLYRINDRNLVNEINNKRIRELLSLYDARKIRNETGEVVWTGQVDIESRKNRRVTTAVPFKEMVKAPKPGIYVLMARDADIKGNRWDSWATQWIVVSDLGVSTYVGRDGLSIFVRSFQSAEPKEGVTVRLIARNNAVLGTAKTDDNGRVTFAPGLLRGTGGNQAAAVMAFAEGDFSFLDLLRPAFDLSDRGVAGRAAPGPVDAYLYTERGVYRPGETVHLTALVRNSQANAVTDLPLTIKLFRPDGVQARQFTLVAAVGKSGGYEITIETSKSYRTGSWIARAYLDPKAKPIGSVRFQVEDFVPERLELKLSSDQKTVEPETTTAIKIDGQFLYGAAAADLRVEGELILKQDMRPYPKYKGYIFGLVQETWRPKRKALPAVRTDAKGAAALEVKLDGVPETSRPLKAEVRVSLIEPGGRAVERTISLPVRWAPLTLGIKLDSEDGRVA